LRAQIDQLKQKQNTLLKLNEELNHDIEASTHHLEELTEHNHELVHELDRYHKEDVALRAKLDRKDKVDNIKLQSGEKMRNSLIKMHSTLKSPGKKGRPSNSGDDY